MLYNLITAPLTGLINPMWSDRIFYTLYIAGFGFGLRYMLRGFNKDAGFIACFGMLFCINKLLTTGFLNNSLSFVIWFWLTGWWWRNRNSTSLNALLITSLILMLLYLSHPMGWIYGSVMIGCLALGLYVFEIKTESRRIAWQKLRQRLLAMLIASLPELILFLQFVFTQNWSTDWTTQNTTGKLSNLVTLDALKCLTPVEALPVKIIAGISLVLMGLGLMYRIRQRKFLPTDGVLMFIVFVLYILIIPPKAFSGGLEIGVRMTMVAFIAFLSFMASVTFSRRIKTVVVLCSLGLSFWLMVLRYPVHKAANEYAMEIYSCLPHIADTSTLLVLNNDWNGHTPEGTEISEKGFMFNHVDCYLGIDKSLIISDNYEANYSYFPVIARWNTNMYAQTDKDGINFDNRPPRADILSYKRRAGHEIDYVLMIGYAKQTNMHPYTKEIMDQLDSAYTKEFVTEFERAVLYKRN